MNEIDTFTKAAGETVENQDKTNLYLLVKWQQKDRKDRY